ncbi:MAG: hypothetical protein E7551_09260 [Ruminococcaceae bacterium]|nr:hypothetical protein [Oscillospiraceae bacterium]
MKKIERNPLRDILDHQRIHQLEKAGTSTIFPVYKPKDDIGKNIFAAINKRLIDLGNGKLGIPMDDVEKKVGLLSQCQGLQTLVSLVNDFGLDFDDRSYDTLNGRSIRNIMDAILKDIINKLRVSDIEIDEDSSEQSAKERFIFDASPYDSVHFNTEIASIETITWVLPTFFQILVIHAKAGQICKWENNLVRIIRYGLSYINKAFIDGSKNPDGKGLKIGWNFARDCEEPSLYFTFAVGECFLDMFATFEEVLKHPYNVMNNTVYGTEIDQDEQKTFLENQEKFKQEEIDNANNPKDIARHTPYNELVRLFRMINSNDRLGEQDLHEEIKVDTTGRYGVLEKHLKDVAREIWRFVKDDLADKFFYNDLASKLTEEDLRMSTTSDALFNTVYIANILIDAGMDEILQLEMRQAEIKSNDSALTPEERQNQENIAVEKQREYENLLESCQLAVQRAFRTYESLKNSGKDYIVDQFLIGFNERFVVHKDRVNDLRKLRMRVFSLLPMLIHTNNVINTYLVKYPQVNMQKYAAYILENRYSEENDEEQFEWIWEKDGYFSGSNYYYVNAVKELYEYYEEYEETYIPIGENNQKYEQKFIKKLNGPHGEITLLKAEHEKTVEEKQRTLDQYKAQIEELENQLREERAKKPTIEDGIRELIQKEINQQFVANMTRAFNQAAKVLAPNTVDSTEDENGEYTELTAAMLEMFVAESYGKNSMFKECDPEVYKQQTKYFKNDLRAIINHNIDDISNDVKYHQSNMYTKLG